MPPANVSVTSSTPQLQRATLAMASAGVDALLIGPGADLRYLIGYRASASERLTLLVARADGKHCLIVPALERPLVEGLGTEVDIKAWAETDDPFSLAASVLDGLAADAVLAAGNHLWATFLLGLQEVRPGARWERASSVLGALRMRKTPAEIEKLRRAGAAIDRVHRCVPGLLRPGKTEQEVAAEIAHMIVEEGHDHSEFVIVASGPNGASPHHKPGPRRLEPGDVVVVDIGGPCDGYFSDCTRNYLMGTPPPGFAEAQSALLAAQQAAFEAVQPGVTAGAIGIRIEDIVVVTPQAGERLNLTQREAVGR